MVCVGVGVCGCGWVGLLGWWWWCGGGEGWVGGWVWFCASCCSSWGADWARFVCDGKAGWVGVSVGRCWSGGHPHAANHHVSTHHRSTDNKPHACPTLINTHRKHRQSKVVIKTHANQQGLPKTQNRTFPPSSTLFFFLAYAPWLKLRMRVSSVATIV
jgi:hypothetical protein